MAMSTVKKPEAEVKIQNVLFSNENLPGPSVTSGNVGPDRVSRRASHFFFLKNRVTQQTECHRAGLSFLQVIKIETWSNKWNTLSVSLLRRRSMMLVVSCSKVNVSISQGNRLVMWNCRCDIFSGSPL